MPAKAENKKTEGVKRRAPEQSSGSFGPFAYIIVATILTLLALPLIGTYCKENKALAQCKYVERAIEYFNFNMDVVMEKMGVFTKQTEKTSSKPKTATSPKKNNPKAKKDLSNAPWMKEPIPGAKTLSDDDIKFVEGGPYYLVIIGHVFDVSSGAEMYTPGSGYHGFIGRDSSRAFVTGEFNEQGLTDDLSGLNDSDYLGLADWIKFYLDHKSYKFVGYHVSKFFDSKGAFTPDFEQFRSWVKKAEAGEDKEQELKKIFPPCNVQWNAEEGSKLWCTKQSGGIQRDWIGYPRQFFEPNQQPRCVCVHPNMFGDPRIKTYEECDEQSHECKPKD